MTDYEKVIEFFSEHEIAIYGFGPTDYGAEEGTLLWCIKELDDIYNRSKGIVLADRGRLLISMRKRTPSVRTKTAKPSLAVLIVDGVILIQNGAVSPTNR